jgi:hypothetical protein
MLRLGVLRRKASERRAYAQLAAEYGAYHAPPDKSDRDQGSGVLIILPRPAGEAKTGETGMVIEGETKVQAAEGVIVASPKGSDADSD